jgi:glycosyltransferase involved in cell wall biosynthesis
VVGVQAAALGLALVVSRVGGWSDVVDEGRNGFMIDPQDAAGFAAALRRLLSDPHALQAFRQESRALAARFDLDKIVAQYEQVLAEASRAA